jgi:broad specificity phosphatase PhoE
MKEFLLIRHGQSFYNIRETTDLDSELTEDGAAQALVTAKYLRDRYDHLNGWKGRVSPFKRTLQTAQIVNEVCGIEFEVDYGAVEIMVKYDRVPLKCRMDEYPHFYWPKFMQKDIVYCRESMEWFWQRMKEYMESFGDGKWLVVSHGTPVQRMHDYLVGDDREASFDLIKNCSITHVVDGKTICFNEVVY